MFVVSNLTKTSFVFQGVTIPAYESADFECISDFVTLSRLLNSGKATYGSKKSVVKPVEEEPKEVEVAVEVKAEPIVEEVKEPEIVVDPVPEVEEAVVEAVDEVAEKPSKKRRSSKDEK